MAIQVFPAPASGKSRRVETLTSGTSYTVPAGVTYINATLVGGGQGGGTGGSASATRNTGIGGQVISTYITTTPGASISYAIGAGGAAGGSNANGAAGGNTTMTGATTANGGNGTTDGITGGNGGLGSASGGGSTGGAGQIIIEYWI